VLGLVSEMAVIWKFEVVIAKETLGARLHRYHNVASELDALKEEMSSIKGTYESINASYKEQTDRLNFQTTAWDQAIEREFQAESRYITAQREYKEAIIEFPALEESSLKEHIEDLAGLFEAAKRATVSEHELYHRIHYKVNDFCEWANSTHEEFKELELRHDKLAFHCWELSRSVKNARRALAFAGRRLSEEVQRGSVVL